MGYRTGAAKIMQALAGLHGAAHSLGVPTLAVGIPPSAYQQRDSLAAETAADVNAQLCEWCQGTALAEFEPHPVSEYDPSSGLWSYSHLLVRGRL